MLLNEKKRLTVILFMLLVAFAQGCGREDDKVETTEPVRSFKITRIEAVAAPEISKGTAALKPQGMEGEETGVAKPVAKPAVKARPMPVVDVVAGRAQKTAPSEAVVPVQETIPSQSAAPVKDKTPQAAAGPLTEMKPLLPVQALSPAEVAVKVYDPTGRIDPFSPLFGEKATGSPPPVSGREKTVRESRQAMLTPLEKMDISQLKLVGIVMTHLRKLAMAEDGKGKGYVVKKGTYVGRNSGRVVKILKTGVVIEEEVEDYMGKIVVRKRELKLQKPLGEE